MRNFQEQNKWSHIMQSRPVLFILFLIVVFFLWSIIGLVSKAEETSKNKNLAEDRKQELLDKKERLTKDIEKLNTEKGIEESIRDKFGYVKQGEEMIVVVENKNPTIVPDQKATGIFGFFKRLFK